MGKLWLSMWLVSSWLDEHGLLGEEGREEWEQHRLGRRAELGCGSRVGTEEDTGDREDRSQDWKVT